MSSQTGSSSKFRFYRLREIRKNLRISWLVLRVDGRGFFCTSFTAFPERANWPASDLISEDLYDARSVVDSADNIKPTLDQMDKSSFFDTIDKAVEHFDPFTFNPARGWPPTAAATQIATAPGVVPGTGFITMTSGAPSIATDEASINNQLLELLRQFNATTAEWVSRPAETKGRILFELVLK